MPGATKRSRIRIPAVPARCAPRSTPAGAAADGWGPCHAAADLEARVRAVERLALLARENLGERLSICLDRVGDLVQVVDALFVAECGPRGLRGLGAIDRRVDVSDALHRHAADELAGRGVVHLAAVGDSDRLEQAFVCMHVVFSFEMDGVER